MSALKSLSLGALVCVGLAGAAGAQTTFGFATFSASINQAGQTVRGVGIQSSTRSSGGVYVINFTRPVETCVIVASPEGAEGGQASVERQAVTSRIRVYTFNKIGQAANRAFMVLVSCT